MLQTIRVRTNDNKIVHIDADKARWWGLMRQLLDTFGQDMEQEETDRQAIPAHMRSDRYDRTVLSMPVVSCDTMQRVVHFTRLDRTSNDQWDSVEWPATADRWEHKLIDTLSHAQLIDMMIAADFLQYDRLYKTAVGVAQSRLGDRTLTMQCLQALLHDRRVPFMYRRLVNEGPK